ncbi:MAG: bifunctional (p)ppGpp synthetase/guanosine-3',5'-bis(diphosphate) 3'-pyrophosphohydrolase [Candidatus Diapherotrites archaeon]|nr:bifunctional (p)ppGpp synthetase/guanosine-3',5'-bis(diphosphate) 3'-pyrophosphohydrolase [Candidatus Diapherotrites archaeon]
MNKVNELLEEIIRLTKENGQTINQNKLKESVLFAEKVHENEVDEKGVPFIKHPLETAKIAAQIGADETTILACILHNTYTPMNHTAIQTKPENKKEAQRIAGEEVTNLIDSMEKIILIEERNKEKLQEVVEPLLIASSNDPRIILLRLVLRIEHGEPKENTEASRKYAEDTIKIYSPIAHKLGIYSIKSILEDISFKVLEPKKFNELEKEVNNIRYLEKKSMNELIEIISDELKKNNIKAKIQSRQKNIYSIYEKMKKKKKSIKEIYDLNAIRVIADSIEDCYKITGIINSKWTGIPEEYDDYISKPKTNFYQSIHMALIGPKKKVFEIQIRTQEMHELAEFGVASHTIYKGRKKSIFDFKFNLLRQINKLKQNEDKEKKIDFNITSEKIITLTPKGEAIALPLNATPVDFAYAVHSELGEHCEKAKVNGKLVTLDYPLSNLDTIEIITSKEQKPKLSWLSFVKSGKARGKINQFFNIFSKKREEIAIPKNTLIITEKDSRIKLAKCCNPLPGEEITAISTTKRKYSVHKKDCLQLEKLNNKERIKVEWGQDSINNQETEIIIKTLEKPNILIEILKKIEELKAPVTNAKVITKEKNLKLIIRIKAKNLKQLNKIIDETMKINGVLTIKRN